MLVMIGPSTWTFQQCSYRSDSSWRIDIVWIWTMSWWWWPNSSNAKVGRKLLSSQHRRDGRRERRKKRRRKSKRRKSRKNQRENEGDIKMLKFKGKILTYNDQSPILTGSFSFFSFSFDFELPTVLRLSDRFLRDLGLSSTVSVYSSF